MALSKPSAYRLFAATIMIGWVCFVGTSSGTSAADEVGVHALTSWHLTPEPQPPKGAGLYGMSCPSSTFCMATGYGNDGPPIASAWNGHTWRLADTTNASDGYLNSVSCPTSGACVAVGARDPGEGSNYWPMTERFEGGRWVQLPSVFGSYLDTRLSSVSCTSMSFCVAVGWGGKHAITGLIAAWNGASWKVQPTPFVSISTGGFLMDVTCLSSSFCMLVGAGTESDEPVPVSAIWNGATWQSMPLPTSTRDNDAIANGVSCISTDMCVAVGSNNDETPLAWSWNGTAWTSTTSLPKLGRFEDMNGVYCQSISECVATGTNGVKVGRAIPLIEVWESGRWVSAKAPAVAGQTLTQMYSVSCIPQTQDCFTDGLYNNGPGSPLGNVIEQNFG